MIVGGMSRERLKKALSALSRPDLRRDPAPARPALALLASPEITDREELLVAAKLARREDAEYRYRAVTRRFKRRLCRWGLCPRLADAHGLCREHWRKGHAMLAHARLERQGLEVAA